MPDKVEVQLDIVKTIDTEYTIGYKIRYGVAVSVNVVMVILNLIRDVPIGFSLGLLGLVIILLRN